MRSKAARLYGVVSPTGLNDGFYVPVFADPERSNHLLVQIVDEQNYIEEFEPFFTTAEIKSVDLDVTKEVGDLAFWYFELGGRPLCGEIPEIRNKFRARRAEVKDNPHITLQIVTACRLDGEELTIQAARESLLKSIGRAAADSWLDVNILSPKVRSWLIKSPRTGRRTDFEFLLSRVLAVTAADRTAVLAPEALRAQIGVGGWRKMTEQLTSLLQYFKLQFAELAFLEDGASHSVRPSDVPLLKREAVSAFARGKGRSLRQMTKSYFEDPSGGLRAVCTFSSRYDGKGKRKYWFGYHKIWDQWLEGASDGFLL